MQCTDMCGICGGFEVSRHAVIFVYVRVFEQSEKEEVTIKRMIGLKKDEYFVDGKHVT